MPRRSAPVIRPSVRSIRSLDERQREAGHAVAIYVDVGELGFRWTARFDLLPRRGRRRARQKRRIAHGPHVAPLVVP